MKKMNNKGMTLVELIASFMIVSVAMLYFFQTLRTVQKVYEKSVEQTNEYIDMDYAIRIVANFVENTGGISYTDSDYGEEIDLNDILSDVAPNFEVDNCDSYTSENYGFNKRLCYNLKYKDNTVKKLFFYIPIPLESNPSYDCYKTRECSPFNIEERDYGSDGEYIPYEDDIDFDNEPDDENGFIEDEDSSMCEDDDCE